MGLFDIKTITAKTWTADTWAANIHSTQSNSIKNWRLGAIITLIFTLVPGLTFSATPAGKGDLEDERWFEVELIIFAHNSREVLESEKWPEITNIALPEKVVELNQPTPGLPEEPKAVEQSLIFEPVNPDTDMADPEPISMPDAFVMLRDEDLQLKDAVKKLTKSSKFDPLLHLAWRQPTYSKEHAQTVLLYEGMTDPEFVVNDDIQPGEPDTKTKAASVSKSSEVSEEAINPRFVGTARLSVARYLHFAVDLVYRTPVSQRVAIPLQDSSLLNDSPYPPLSYPQGPAYQIESWNAMRGFRLKESRRMRSKRIHYLDHPFLGVVVQITPVELPKDPEEPSASDPTNNISSR